MIPGAGLLASLSKSISDEGVALLQDFEGEVLWPYLCDAAKVTIGYGHVMSDDDLAPFGMAYAGVKARLLTVPGPWNWKKFQGLVPVLITHEQSTRMFRRDLARFEDVVNASVTVPLTQHQFDALVSLAFNIGTVRFASSTLVRLLNAGDSLAVEQFHVWRMADGKVNAKLVARRKREADLFSRV